MNNGYDESKRLQKLRETQLLDTPPESTFDEIVHLARQYFQTPIACISLIDDNRQWFKASTGIDLKEMPRSQSICVHLLHQTLPLVLEDASQDSRFANNPLVTAQPGIRFYAGAPLVLDDNIVLGSLIVADHKTRTINQDALQILTTLARQAVTEIQLRITIREHQKREEELARAFALQRIAGTAARLGGWFLSLKDNKISCSEEIQRIFELPPNHTPSLDEFAAFYSPDNWKLLREYHARCINDGIPFDLELEMLTAKGRPIWGRASGEAVRDEHGKIIALQGAFQDITERVLAEQSAKAAENRVRLHAESLPVIVWSATPDGQLNYINQHFFNYAGLPIDSDPATCWQATLHPQDLQPSLKTWEKAISKGVPFNTKYRIRRASDGVYRWFQVQAKPIRDHQGRITHWFGTSIDIHDIHEAHQNLTQDAALISMALRVSQLGAWRVMVKPGYPTTWSPEVYQIFDLPNDYVPEVDSDILRYAPEHRELIREAFEACLHEGKNYNLECKVITHAGKHIWIRTIGEAVKDSDGNTISIQGTIQNITEQRKIGDSIRAQEARFRLLARVTNDAIWDWDLRTNSLWWSNGFETLFGFTREEVDLTIDSWTKRIHPDDSQRVLDDVMQAIDGNNDNWNADYRFQRKDGTYAYVIDRGHIVRDSSGKAIRMVGGISDITERRKNEDKLREQATLLDHAQDAIHVSDLDHRILYWNKSSEHLYGWKADEVIGRPITDILYKKTETFRAATQAVLGNGEWIGEITQYTRNGTARIVETRWTTLRDKDGNPVSILAINTDITERKKLEQQFLRAQRMESIGTLAGGIAHDLNNLLSPIVMGVDLLSHYSRDEQIGPIIESIGQSAKRGTELVKQVLSFARGIEGARVSIQVAHLLREIESIIINTFPKNIHLDQNISQDLWTVLGDPTQLHQIFLNLCVNARDAMPDGGRLTLSARNCEIDTQYASMDQTIKAGRYVLVEIADEGCGMTKEVMEHAFEPFFTTKELGRGTGLGLSSVLGILRSHGGYINVYSEPNNGSSFKIYIPAQAEDTHMDQPPSTAQQNLPRGQGQCVLLVDDEVSILNITRKTLEAFGYQVLTAEDGAHAIATYVSRRDQIDIVMTDMMMPVMDGPSLIIALRHINPNLRIVAASGLNANSDIAKASRSGVRHFLPKPYSADKLLLTLHQALLEPA